MFGEEGERGPRRGRLGREWTVIEKYQSKTRQGPGRGSYYVNPLRRSTGRAQMHFFCIGNAPLLSKPLSPATGASYLWTDGREGKEGIIKWSMWPLQACFVMLSALWDKQPPAGQTFPISIHERWRPCASACLHLFLCYYIFARPLTLPSLYITSVLSCACSRLADL